ncbi:MAG: DNA repair protein RecN, partial [Chloroflexota bacterium]|nr:DNA repair protein RecN [Chloroflexota bacterium]
VYAQLAMGDEGRRGKEPILDSLSAAVSSIDELQRYDSSLAAVLEQANDLLYRLEDLVAAMRDYRDNLDFDPGRMEQIEERFLLLRTLQRKYGGTVAEMLAGAEAAAVELHRLTHSAEHMAGLQAREDELLARLAQLAGDLSHRRRAAGDELAARIVQSTSDLAMPHVKFAVLIEQVADERDGVTLDGGPAGDRIAFDRTGVDRVEFMLAPNPGEPLKPLARIASGGESARLLLAIKSILSMVDTVPTLVFDEVDVGVGGRAGGVVGEKLWGMTANHQVICITHLPQVAAFADTHYTIAKQVDAGRTRSTVEPLDQDRRVDEIAAMLDGVPITDASRSTARTMLERSRAYKEATVAQHPAPAARQAEPRLSSLAT